MWCDWSASSLWIVMRMLESKSVCSGGGAVEVALSTYLENYATSMKSWEQFPITEFAKYLLVIPNMLVISEAQDSTYLKLQSWELSIMRPR